jgi:uncharacterized coiled-coil protein SlyX
MKQLTRKDYTKALMAADWVIVRESKVGEIWHSPDTNDRFTVPHDDNRSPRAVANDRARLRRGGADAKALAEAIWPSQGNDLHLPRINPTRPPGPIEEPLDKALDEFDASRLDPVQVRAVAELCDTAIEQETTIIEKTQARLKELKKMAEVEELKALLAEAERERDELATAGNKLLAEKGELRQKLDLIGQAELAPLEAQVDVLEREQAALLTEKRMLEEANEELNDRLTGRQDRIEQLEAMLEKLGKARERDTALIVELERKVEALGADRPAFRSPLLASALAIMEQADKAGAEVRDALLLAATTLIEKAKG